jgi:hypothetical protein
VGPLRIAVPKRAHEKSERTAKTHSGPERKSADDIFL